MTNAQGWDEILTIGMEALETVTICWLRYHGEEEEGGWERGGIGKRHGKRYLVEERSDFEIDRENEFVPKVRGRDRINGNKELINKLTEISTIKIELDTHCKSKN